MKKQIRFTFTFYKDNITLYLNIWHQEYTLTQDMYNKALAHAKLEWDRQDKLVGGQFRKVQFMWDVYFFINNIAGDITIYDSEESLPLPAKLLAEEGYIVKYIEYKYKYIKV